MYADLLGRLEPRRRPLAPSFAPGLGYKVAVLQPYLFPYLGTFQLASKVDHFVFFDDVAFIKKGFIHRNSILLNGSAHAFTAPVKNVSQNRHIVDHEYVGDWLPVLALLRNAYAKAPYFEAVYPFVQRVLLDPDENVARKNARSVASVFDYLGLPLRFSFSSGLGLPPELRASARVRAVCLAEGADTYINPAGGRALYDAQDFERDGMALRFCGRRGGRYEQRSPEFVPDLSILDALMHCSPRQVLELFDMCELVE